MVGGEGLDLEDVEPGARDLPRPERGHEVIEIHDDPAAHVDQVGRPLHLTELRPPEEPLRLRGVRGGDHDEIAFGQEVAQPVRSPESGHADRRRRRLWVHRHHPHPEG